MKLNFTFAQSEKEQLDQLLTLNTNNPYSDYPAFKKYISTIIAKGVVPESLIYACNAIITDRTEKGNHVHILGNCPIEHELPELNLDNPTEHKYLAKNTFISEGFMELISQLLSAPLFSYQSRNNGDYFTDLVSFNKFKGKKTGFTDGDLIYHCDRSYHMVRADYVSLLGLRVNESELIYTNYIDAKELKKHLSEKTISILSQKIFQTDVDDRSRESNKNWHSSTIHAILLEKDQIRYQDTFTRPQDPNDIRAIKALLELKDAMSQSEKLRHMIKKGEMLIFGNQTGIHNREWIDVNDPEQGRKRWLLKTYSFSDTSKVHEYSNWATVNDPTCFIDN
ncbi:taurine catabolism dioxygenase TauD [Gilliamella sp. CG22]|uniref:taurine catabolism dioxygenase TauD n=1 Tax=Gilliamella sp. CG22 TaxID=3351504 RepID=UPI003985FE27